MAHRNIFGDTYRVCGNYASFLGMTAARLDDGRLLVMRMEPSYINTSDLGGSWVLQKLNRRVNAVRNNGRISELSHLHIGPIQALSMYLTGDLPHLAFNQAAEGSYIRSQEPFRGNRPFIDVPFTIQRRRVTMRISIRAGQQYAGFAVTDKNEVSLLADDDLS